jgi:predicted chitinase
MLNTTQTNNAINIIRVFNSYGVKNKNTIAAVLSVVMKESSLIPQSENLNYSKERLPEVWPIFSTTGKKVKRGTGKNFYNQLAVEHANNEQKLGNFIYCCKYGNTKTTGFLYRGRAYNQLTWHDNYKIIGDFIKVDLVKNPDKANEPEIAAKILYYYFYNSSRRYKIDLNNLNFSNAYNIIYSLNAGKLPTTSGENLERQDTTGGYIRGKKFFPFFLNFIEEQPNGEIKKKINLGLILAIAAITIIIIKNKKL